MVQFERSLVSVLLGEIQTPQPVFQVLTGPRQVGKTTIAHQVMGKLPFASVYASADSPLPPGVEWIETQWRRVQFEANRSGGPVLLVLDEVQKVQGWSESLKYFWDASRRAPEDAGNTTTLAQYLRLLETAFLISGLELFSKGSIRKRGSSPKLILWNNALVNALVGRSFNESLTDGIWWGRLVENAVGAHLLNHLHPVGCSVAYWRRRDQEVDFVITKGSRICAIEVKSGRSGKISGMEAFHAGYPSARRIVVGGNGIPLDEFFSASPEAWI